MLLALKEQKANFNERRKIIAAVVDNIKKSGKLNAKQVGALINKM